MEQNSSLQFAISDRTDLIDSFMKRNNKINLSAIRDTQGVREKHILDSLQITSMKKCPLITKKPLTVCDLGTGGGFPLLPLARVFPQHRFIGLDARKKKTTAINEIIKETGIENCSTTRSRAEEHGSKYDIITCRAVAYADKLLPWIDTILKSGGVALLYKGDKDKERNDIQKRCKKKNWSILEVYTYEMLGDPRMIISIKKK